MIKFHRRALLAVVGLGAGVSFAAPPSGGQWDWPSAVEEMTRARPSIYAAARNIDKARFYGYAAYAPFLPSLAASASSSQREDSAGTSAYSYSYGLTGTLSIFSGFSDALSVRLKNNDLAVARIRFSREMSDAVYDLRRSFVELLWAQEQTELSRAILDRRSKNRDLVRLKYEAGREDKGSLLRVEADAVGAEFEVRKSSRQLATSSRKFLSALGSAASSSVRVSGGFLLEPPPQPAEPDFDKLIKETPEYAEAAKRLAAARLETALTRSQFWPELSASMSYGRAGDRFPPTEESRAASLNLAWRFFSGGKDYFASLAARENELIRSAELKNMILALAASAEAAWRNYVDAAENAGVREKYLDAARVQSEIISAKYFNGLVTYQEWYQVENDYINAQKSLLNARKDAALGEAAWKNILGVSR